MIKVFMLLFILHTCFSFLFQLNSASPPTRHHHLLRRLPRQTLDTSTHILESLLILLGRVLALLALDLFPVIPLHLESAEDDARVEAVDVFGRVAGEAGELLDEVEERVDVFAGGYSIQFR